MLSFFAASKFKDVEKATSKPKEEGGLTVLAIKLLSLGTLAYFLFVAAFRLIVQLAFGDTTNRFLCFFKGPSDANPYWYIGKAFGFALVGVLSWWFCRTKRISLSLVFCFLSMCTFFLPLVVDFLEVFGKELFKFKESLVFLALGGLWYVKSMTIEG